MSPVELLALWSDLEMLSPLDIEITPRRQDRGGVFEVTPGGQAPWERGHSLQRTRLRADEAYAYVLYGGTFCKRELERALLSAVGASTAEAEAGRASGTSALFSMIVTEDGRAVPETLTLSHGCWLLGRALAVGPLSDDWLEGFDRDATVIRERVAAAIAVHQRRLLAHVGERCLEEHARCALPGTAMKPTPASLRRRCAVPGCPLQGSGTVHGLCANHLADGSFKADTDLALAITRVVVRSLGLDSALDLGGAVVDAKVVYRRNATGRDLAPVNSRLSEDLAAVADAADRGRLGPAILRHLVRSGASVAPRQGAPDQAQAADGLTFSEPGYVPVGRWPASPRRPASEAHQLTTNQAWAQLRDSSGLYRVAGAAQAEMAEVLQDVVAAVVVERARVLATLASPEDGFGDETMTWTAPGLEKSISFRPLIQELTGFEIVVAVPSAPAVEALGRSLLDRAELGEEWRSVPGYFAGHGTRLLRYLVRRSAAPKGEKPEGWALLTAALGSVDKRRKFVNNLWFGPPRKPGAAAMSEEQAGMLAWLKDQSARDAAQPWSLAVATFERALQDEATVRRRRQKVRDRRAELRARTEQRADELRAWRIERVMVHEGHLAAVREGLRNAVIDEEVACRAREVAERRRAGHQELRPRWWHSVLDGGKAQRFWREVDRSLADSEVHAERQLAEERARSARWEREVCRVAGLVSDAKQVASKMSDEIATLRAREEAYVEQWSHRFAFPDDRSHSEGGSHDSRAPWLDDEWDRARVEVFLAALDLHRAFITGAGKAGTRLLGAASDAARGGLGGSTPEATLAAWQGIFLMTPVVITTFESVAETFTAIGAEALGWLVVEEGRAVAPQAVVGALWRTRRALVVERADGAPAEVPTHRDLEQAVRAHHWRRRRAQDVGEERSRRKRGATSTTRS